MRRSSLHWLAPMLVLLALAGPAWPQCSIVEEQMLSASDTRSGNIFGQSVSMSAGKILVGARGAWSGGLTSGAAYVYRRSWTEEQKLIPSDPEPVSNFGISVSLDGHRALIGANLKSQSGWGEGAAYVFRFDGSGWIEEQKLTAFDAISGDGFGEAVSLHGDVAAVGALDDHAGTDAGSVYVFRFDGIQWLFEQKLISPGAAAGDYFGRAVSVSGDAVLVGAHFEDPAGIFNAGAAHLFRFDGNQWVHEQTLLASDAAAGDSLGSAVSLRGNLALVGAQSDDVGGGSSVGSAYSFRFDGTRWIEEQKLTASDGVSGDSFGWSVSLDDRVAMVGAPVVDDASGGNAAGAAYLFRLEAGRWTEHQKVFASDAAGGCYFGWSVSVDGDQAVAGAPLNGPPGGRIGGAAYVVGAKPSLAFNGIPAAGNIVNYQGKYFHCETGRRALVLLSCTGTSGFPLPNDGRTVPLTYDTCTSLGLSLSSLLTGTIDLAGRIETPQVQFPIAPAGITVHAAAVSIDLALGAFGSITDPTTFVTQ